MCIMITSLNMHLYIWVIWIWRSPSFTSSLAQIRKDTYDYRRRGSHCHVDVHVTWRPRSRSRYETCSVTDKMSPCRRRHFCRSVTGALGGNITGAPLGFPLNIILTVIIFASTRLEHIIRRQYCLLILNFNGLSSCSSTSVAIEDIAQCVCQVLSHHTRITQH